MLPTPAASIVIPTRERPQYLDVTLASIRDQARRAGAEVLVVSDGGDRATAAVAARYGVPVLALAPRAGLNAARNAGAAATSSSVIVFVDDDVEAPPDWLASLLSGMRRAPDREVFGGPIRARLEGSPPRACGREPAPITTLDFGREDRDVALVWGANMAVRRSALQRVGPFDESLAGAGDEEEWQHRYVARGGRVRYVAQAGLDHRRTASDSTIRSLSRAAYGRGASARRYDVRKGTAPSPRAELRILAGCAWHIIRRRCANGVVLGAHSAGRLSELLAPRHCR